MSDTEYTRESFVGPLCHDQLPHHDLTALHHTFGFSTERFDNLKYVEPDVLLYIAGNYLVKLDMRVSPPSRTYVMGVDGRGLGAFVVHPTLPLVVVGEKGFDPNIYVFEYPSWKVVKVLRKGAERGYSCLAFSADGEKLASVATSPDFILTIWDWKKERITLHTKAFGQDVFKVAFSKDDPGRLITSGTGHIRFWRMAKTFTGLKLQGDIGKFGKVELSDVEDFAELPDGKVLSGTESGALLLWEGNFIKYRLMRKTEVKFAKLNAQGEEGDDVSVTSSITPHQGAVTHCMLIRDPMTNKGVSFVSGGKDGKLCWWDFKEIDEAEIDMDKTTDYMMDPLHEVTVGTGVAIKTIIRGHPKCRTPHVMVVDAHGAIWRVDLVEAFTALKNRVGGDKGYHLEVKASLPASKLFDFHAGQIVAMDTSPVDHFAVTGGKDGSVRCWDYVSRKEVFKLTWGEKFDSTPLKQITKAEEKKIIRRKSAAAKTQDDSIAVAAAAAAAAALAEEDSAETSEGLVTASGEGKRSSVVAVPPPQTHSISSVTTVKWAPTTVAPDGRSVFVGFSDGVVRVLWRGAVNPQAQDKLSNKWVREQVLKPHAGDVRAIAFSPSGSMFASAGADGNVFLFIDSKYSDTVGMSDRPRSAQGPKATRKFDPLGFIPFSVDERGAPTSICFRPDGFGLLVTCSDGRIAEIDLNKVAPGGLVEKGSGGVFNGDSFELTLPVDFYAFKRPRIASSTNQKKGKEETVEPNTAASKEGTASQSSPKTPASAGSSVVNLFPEGEAGEDEEEEQVEEPLPPALHAVYLLNHQSLSGEANGQGNDSGTDTSDANSGSAAVVASTTDSSSQPSKVSFSNTPTDLADSSGLQQIGNNKLKKSGFMFAVSFGGDLAGKLFHCQFDKEEVLETFSLGTLSKVPPQTPLAIASEFVPRTSCLRYSSSNQFLLSGASDGSITVRQSGQGGERKDPLEWCYLRMQPHDGDSAVNAVSLSYDNKFLLSAGDDGYMVVQRIKCGGIEPLALSGIVEHRRRVTAFANDIAYTPLAENIALTMNVPRALLSPAQAVGGPVVETKKADVEQVVASTEQEVVGEAEATAKEESEETATTTVAESEVESAAPVAATSSLSAYGVAVCGAEGEVGPVPYGFDEVPSAIAVELQSDIVKKIASNKINIEEVVDIQDPNAYTIQDAKLKTDEDQRKLEAEAKKKEVLEQIAQLQKEFEEIVSENELQPPEAMLTDDELLVDPELAAILNDQGHDMIEEVHKECAYATEKSERRLMKLGDRFLEPVITEHCSLSTFNLVGTSYAKSGAGSRGEVSCSNFVVARPSDHLTELLEAIGLEMRAEQQSLKAAQNNDPRNRQSIVTQGEALVVAGGSNSQVSVQGSESYYGGYPDDFSTDSQKEKKSLEAQRKIRRHLRQSELTKLANQKPGKNDDDPADIKAIALAEKTMGDYKLKAAEDYEVEEGVVVNKHLKLRELVLFEDAIMKRKNAYNEKFFALRNAKRHTTVSVAQAILRISQITAELGDDGVDSSGVVSNSSGKAQQRDELLNSFRQMTGCDNNEELPMPILDAKNEWPSSRHLHTAEELAEFRLLTEGNTRPLTEVADQLPPLTVVPGLRRGLASTAETAARYHAAHGGYGGDATKNAVHHFHLHNVAQTHSVARSLSNLPIMHYLDHHRSFLRNKKNRELRHKQISSENPANDTAFEEKKEDIASKEPASAPPSAAAAHNKPNGVKGGNFALFGQVEFKSQELLDREEEEAAMLRGEMNNDKSSSMATGGGGDWLQDIAEEAWVRRVLLEAERTSLKMRASQQLKNFNDSLLELRRERMELAADFCGCEVTRLTRLRELRLLADFEVKDQALAAKIDKCTRDRGEAAAGAAETKSKIRAKKEECARFKSSELEVNRDFLRAVPPSHAFHAQLMKIFKRKIKRAKKRVHEDVEDDEEEEESSEEEESEEEDDEEEEAEADDSCPSGCDLGLYEEVLMLRVKRLDSEEKVAELSKIVDELEKAHLRLTSKEKQVEKELNLTTAEVRRYQTEKQKTLNQLMTPIPLKISQLCCFDHPDPLGKGLSSSQNQLSPATNADVTQKRRTSRVYDDSASMVDTASSVANQEGAGIRGSLIGGGGRRRSSFASFADRNMSGVSIGYSGRVDSTAGQTLVDEEDRELPMSQLLPHAGFGTHCIFPASGLRGLSHRIHSLAKETEAERSALSELHKKKKQLERARSTAEVSIKEQEEKNEGLQLLRFGQMIDMEVVEAGDSGAMREEAAGARIRLLEASNEAEMRKHLKKQKALKEALLTTTQENTQLLSKIADLSGRQFALEKELNGSAGNNLVGDGGPSLRSEVEERNKLVALVKLQAKEVEALKAEINLLRRKGGHVYVPPLPQPNPSENPQPPPM